MKRLARKSFLRSSFHVRRARRLCWRSSDTGGTPVLRTSVLRCGFTLVEVLAAMLLLAIVLPIAMQGITNAERSASATRRRTEAAGLAEAQLGQVLASGQWQNGVLTGDFGSDWPDYHWQASVQNWAQDTTSLSVQQIDLRVIWQNAAGRDESVLVSTLAYERGNQQ